MRRIISGSLRLQKRLHDAVLVASSCCPFCNMCDETVRHCFWECPQWNSIRSTFAMPSLVMRSTWPACTLDCGIFVEDVRVLCLRSQLQQEEDEAGDIPSYFKCSECRTGVRASEESQEQQVIWTDGAAPKNQDDRFRRAGSGIYYGHGDPLNMSAILPGLVQTNQRAELLAVVLVCLRDPRPLDIRTDSSYVCNGFASWRSWMNGG